MDGFKDITDVDVEKVVGNIIQVHQCNRNLYENYLYQMVENSRLNNCKLDVSYVEEAFDSVSIVAICREIVGEMFGNYSGIVIELFGNFRGMVKELLWDLKRIVNSNSNDNNVY